ncbi:unnamed protein product [Cladocopium goreaui]|uniref:Uncharacterized protein n=1 Tax=Cladocopium goreaui TaxID=2562237 RepID=A0A9P1DU77_9DINO|nr:unnamed protein product [Cladocopium goreaui]
MVLEELPGGYNEKSMTEGLEPREQPEAVKELALRRAEVLLSLENWCQALKNVENLPQAQDAESELKESFHEKLQSRLRDALFLDICNVLSFPSSSPKPVAAVAPLASRPAATPGTPTTPVKISSRQISKSAGLMMTPRTSGSGRLVAAPRTGGALTSREPLTSRRSLNGALSSAVASSLTPRRPGGSLSLSKSARPATSTSAPKSARPSLRTANVADTASARQFQMPAFAGVVRRAGSPRGSPTASERGRFGSTSR